MGSGMKHIAAIALCATLCNALAAVTLLDGERSFDVDFSGGVPPASFQTDMKTSGHLAAKGEISFDLFIEDASLFVVGYVYLGSGGGWYLHGLAPEKNGEWETFRFPVSSLGVEGTPAGLDKIHTIRLVLRRGGRGKGVVKIRNVVCSDTVSPGLTEAERHERVATERARILAMPGKKGERRFAWCHTAYGPYKGDWDRAVREVKDLGFTDLIVNLCWGVNSAYGSNVLPTAKALDEYGDLLEKCKTACRSHGIKFHVWRMCWRIAEWYTPKEEVDAMEAEGLLQRNTGGQVLRKWLCPTNPKNRKREAAALLELASKGVDGIQFDTIRYASYDTCFCEGCRKMFEKRIGRTLSDSWNLEIWNDESLKKEWRDFRAEVISSLVRGVSKRVHEQYPGVEVSAAVFFDPVEDRNGSGQDWSGWCREGLLDFACPMDYSSSALMFRSRLRVQNEYRRNTPFYPGIGLSIFPSDGREAGRAADQIAAVREEGFGGFTVFQYEAKTIEILKLLSEGPCGL